MRAGAKPKTYRARVVAAAIGACAGLGCAGRAGPSRQMAPVIGGVGATCAGTMPADAPSFLPGQWVDITPPGILKGKPLTCIGQGIAVDPCNTGTVYWGNTPYEEARGGLFKTKNGGASWMKLGPFDEPLHIRIDPRNPDHLYVGDGVRGNTRGFWVSWDGGETWAKPRAWSELAQREHIFIDDVYDVAVDPSDFDHVLVSSHSPYAPGSAAYGESAGIVETRDGGESWLVHKPKAAWGYGHSIDFLYAPDGRMGDAKTWLLGTQTNGIWRTQDGGSTWQQVTPINILHGGSDSYYSKAGVLYAGSVSGVLRSTDNGASWALLELGGGVSSVHGDGNLLYTGVAYLAGPQPILTSLETDGLVWRPMSGGAQAVADGGPFEMAFDRKSGVLYSSDWMQGVWALKTTPP